MPGRRESLELLLWVRLTVAAVAGVAVGAVVLLAAHRPLPDSILTGYVAAAAVFAVPLLWTLMRVGPGETERYVHGMDPTTSETDLIVIVSSLASLVGIGVMLTTGGSAHSTRVAEGALAMAAVACGWLLIHLTYTLRYARQWYLAEPGCVDFNGEEEPTFADFAYLSFDLGMTYQVSDTNLKTGAMRRIVLRHTLLSYVFGTVIVASTLNLVIGLAT